MNALLWIAPGAGPPANGPRTLAAILSGAVRMDDVSFDAAEDRRDIHATLRGDEDAFERLVRRYQPLVFRQMFRFSRDRVQLDELVQEVFVEAYFSLKSYRAKAPFLHWLRRIATRVGYRHWKRAGRQQKIDTAARQSSDLQVTATNDPSDAGEIVYALLQQLAPADRLVLTMMYLDECDNDEIAERTGWSRTLVRVRAHRARNRLKKILDDQDIEL